MLWSKKPSLKGKTALVVGAMGFVGQYLTRALSANGAHAHATKLLYEEMGEHAGLTIHNMDVTERSEVDAVMRAVKPDYVFHLAAQSSVSISWRRPNFTVDVNINGALNVLDAVREIKPDTRVILVGSSEEYGPVRPQDVPVKESTQTNPQNIYAITKNTVNQIGTLYAQAYDMDVICTRSFNHIGPHQAPIFVVSDFCMQIAEIEAGKREARLCVGNLSAKRDFTNVQDVVEAYLLLALHGKKGETYNVGSGRAVSIQSLLDRLLELSTSDITVDKDHAKFRPVDVPVIEADISKLQEATGWAPSISLEQTLQETLQYWREEYAD